MFPDKADWLHRPDRNHDLDLLHRRGKLSISLQLWSESLFPLELTSAEASPAQRRSPRVNRSRQVMSFIPKHWKLSYAGKKHINISVCIIFVYEDSSNLAHFSQNTIHIFKLLLECSQVH